MTYFHVTTDAETGETIQIPFTADEIANHEEQEAAALNAAYKLLRAAEYPPITDYIDGVVKGDQQQIDAYIAACLAIKAKYPKP